MRVCTPDDLAQKSMDYSSCYDNCKSIMTTRWSENVHHTFVLPELGPDFFMAKFLRAEKKRAQNFCVFVTETRAKRRMRNLMHVRLTIISSKRIMTLFVRKTIG